MLETPNQSGSRPVGQASSVSRPARLAPGLAALAGYDRRWLSKDVLSGIWVAAIALPVGLP